MTQLEEILENVSKNTINNHTINQSKFMQFYFKKIVV